MDLSIRGLTGPSGSVGVTSPQGDVHMISASVPSSYLDVAQGYISNSQTTSWADEEISSLREEEIQITSTLQKVKIQKHEFHVPKKLPQDPMRIVRAAVGFFNLEEPEIHHLKIIEDDNLSLPEGWATEIRCKRIRVLVLIMAHVYKNTWHTITDPQARKIIHLILKGCILSHLGSPDAFISLREEIINYLSLTQGWLVQLGTNLYRSFVKYFSHKNVRDQFMTSANTKAMKFHLTPLVFKTSKVFLL